MAETLLKDVRYALRWMRRSPGFSVVAILSLGLGVGVNTAMFSLVDSLLFRPLPVTRPTRSSTSLPAAATATIRDHFLRGLSRPQGAEHRLQRHDGLQPDVGAAQLRRSIAHRAGAGGDLQPLHDARRATVLGRMLVPADDEPGAPRVVVISHRMWQREFGSHPAIAGKT